MIVQNLRGLEVEETGCSDPVLNVFYGKTGDFVFCGRQPRKLDSSAHRLAWRGLSDRTFDQYRRAYVEPHYYDSKYRCGYPLYRGEVPGWVPLIMEGDGKIVGFSDMFFKYGSEYQSHQIADNEIGCSMNLCVIDRYQGLGVGSYYANISVCIAKHFGADWALGSTKIDQGMYHIRIRDDWETVAKTRDGYAIIRKRLI